MPKIDLSMLNQRQTPAFYADVLANRPAAGFIGRIFVSTNTYAFYRDNGTSWDLIGGPGTGTITGSGAVNQIAYWNGTNTITGDNELYYDSTNNYLGVGTNAPGAAIDAHSAVNVIQQLNQTVATNNSLLAFQNAGAGLWRIGNFYNTGANDFGVYDVVGDIQPVTIKKTTGQVLIGPATVGSGKLVVSSNSGDNGIQIVGASAPSLRIDNAGTGPTLRIGLGISTAKNNFIQGSASGNMCVFNGSTTASPILFGIYDAAAVNVQEAARISAARNFLIGTIVDAGQKLQVSGTAYISGNTSIGSTSNTYILQTSADGVAGQIQFDQYGTAGANILLRNAKGTSASPTATQAGDLLGSIGVRGYDGTNFSGGGRAGVYMYAAENFTSTNQGSFIVFGTTPIGSASRVERIRLNDNGNLLIGTTTDAGQKLQVNGTALVSSNFTSQGNIIIWGGNAAEAGQITANGINGGLYISASGTNQSIRIVPSGTGIVQVTSQLDVTSNISIANTVTASVLNTVTNKVSIVIGGVQYYLLATTSPT